MGDALMAEDLSVRLDNRKTLWVTEISRKTFESQALEDIESDGGLFVVLEDSVDGRFEILAKVASIWAGQCLLELFAATLGRSLETA
jgi:hypothetical protein